MIERLEGAGIEVKYLEDFDFEGESEEEDDFDPLDTRGEGVVGDTASGRMDLGN